MRPALITNSPAIPLIVRGGTDVTFSADFTDGGAGFPSKYAGSGSPARGGLAQALHSQGVLDGDTQVDDNNDVTLKGGIRLVVAGNVVGLAESDFTKIDGGWSVSKTINSNALQSIAPNVPWYFEVRDRANNSRRTSGTITGKSSADEDDANNTIVDTKFKGQMATSSFLGSEIR